MSYRLACAALALALAPSPTSAMEGTIEGVAITFPAPAGFCELTDAEPADKRLLDSTRKTTDNAGLRLISFSADCQQLVDWRAGKRKLLDDLAHYQTIKASAAATKESLDLTCADLRTKGDQLVSQNKADWKANVEQVNKQMKVNDTQFAGFLGEDANACYAALLQKLRTEAGTDKTALTVMAATVIKGKFVFLYRIATFVNSDTINDRLERLKLTLAALLAAN
jgi:hypothetical protein